MNRYVVVGGGRAGQARMRSLAAFSELEGVLLPARSSTFKEDFQRQLADPTVLAVVVCTANQTHYEMAYAALDASKHVLVEFPLTATAGEAETLFELARRRQRVLHVEFIGLMTPSHQAYREMSQARWCHAHVRMAGGYYRWVREEAEAGRWGSLLNGRLQALHHLFGNLSLTRATLGRQADGYELSVELTTETGIEISIVDTRQVDCPRVRDLTIYDRDGRVISPKINRKPMALFQADLEVFRAKIAGHEIGWSLPSESDVIEVIRLSHLISEQCAS
ncbi:MAG: Gfo/Idh/MocA family oxidoreductase [Bradymonadia bacterium]